MIDNRRAQLIAEVVKHLEMLDGDDLKSGMAPKEEMKKDIPGVGDNGSQGPMEALLVAKGPAGEAAGGMPHGEKDEDIDDEDLEELSALSS